MPSPWVASAFVFSFGAVEVSTDVVAASLLLLLQEKNTKSIPKRVKALISFIGKIFLE
jgi:hypothetical protein